MRGEIRERRQHAGRGKVGVTPKNSNKNSVQVPPFSYVPEHLWEELSHMRHGGCFPQIPDSAQEACLILPVALIKHCTVLWVLYMVSPSGLRLSHTDTHTCRDTHKHIHTETHTQTHKRKHIYRYIHTDTQIHTNTDTCRHIHRQADTYTQAHTHFWKIYDPYPQSIILI